MCLAILDMCDYRIVELGSSGAPFDNTKDDNRFSLIYGKAQSQKGRESVFQISMSRSSVEGGYTELEVMMSKFLPKEGVYEPKLIRLRVPGEVDPTKTWKENWMGAF